MGAEHASVIAAAKALVASLTGTHEGNDPPDADQRTGAYWWGKPDEELAWALSMANLISREPIAQALYLAHVADDVSRTREVKEWGYRVAVEFAGAKGSGQRRRSMVESYRPDWGHQAARDGLALALWPHLAEEIPGRDARCKTYGVGHQAFQRVRGAVENRAKAAYSDFRADLMNLLDGRWTRDMRGRWESATGREWADERV